MLDELSKGKFPYIRLRRNRKSQFIRDLVQENRLTAKDLVYPVFILDGVNREESIKNMPDQLRLSIDKLMYIAEKCINLNIPAIALFPYIESKKDESASESYNKEGLMAKAIRAVKSRFPELGVFTDIALDPYTIHGQDGIIDDRGYVLNDVTNSILVKQALCYAEAGADFVCPSDMMDGRIGVIRKSLEDNGFVNTGIMAYAVKYASNFYNPFREAVGSATYLGKSDKFNYQMNSANSDEAIHEVKLDIDEGADIVMIKPALTYLDVVYRIKNVFNFPVSVYHVSGEYAMLKLASNGGIIDYEKTLMELMLCFKRSGADIIWSYAAIDVAEILKKLGV
ncbi:MAG TPA: porphobilinogen synthase [Burkholderiales bacterium]|nr:porphobilinogen synthase [Burkholderiales bacterium]